MIATSVKSRLLRCLDGLTAIGGTLICSLVVLFLDVVVDGGYIFSAVVCPLLFLTAIVRAILRRPRLSVVTARVLIPIVTGMLVVVNYYVQRTTAMDNAASLIQACELYRQANGAYPERLSELVPRYLTSVPRAKYCCSSGEFGYSGSPLHTLFWWECPPFGRRVYTFETGKWRYVD